MITAFFDAFKAQCPPETEVLLGSEHLEDNSSPPRIVIFPTHGTYEQNGAEAAFNPITQKKEVPFGRRTLSVAIVIWGQTLAQTDQACSEVYALLSRHFRMESIQETWDTEEPLVQDGVAVMLTVPLIGSVFTVPTYTTIQTFTCSSCQG